MNLTLNTAPKFTYTYNKKVQIRIISDLNIIKNELLKYIPEIKALILAGGFGRGEGSVLLQDGLVQPINDYDIYIILPEKKINFDSELIRNNISKIIKIRQIDFDYIKINKLKFLKPTMANYDLKYASYVFYGDKTILENIPKIQADKLKLREGRTPLLLYLISIIQAYPSKNSSINDIFWSYQQISKSILGWSTALLILEGKYHFSYIEREKRFNSSFNNSAWCKLVKEATRFKISPKIEIKENINELWHTNKNIHLQILKLFLSKYYNKNFKDWNQLIYIYKYDFENIVKNIYGYLINDKRFKKRIYLTIVELLLLLSKKQDDIDSVYMKILSEEVSKINKKYEIHDWNEARIFCIDNDPNCEIWKNRGNKIFY